MRLGLTDGSFTEVVAGEVTDGAEVIVGASDIGRAKGTAPAGGAPRLRL